MGMEIALCAVFFFGGERAFEDCTLIHFGFFLFTTQVYLYSVNLIRISREIGLFCLLGWRDRWFNDQ